MVYLAWEEGVRTTWNRQKWHSTKFWFPVCTRWRKIKCASYNVFPSIHYSLISNLGVRNFPRKWRTIQELNMSILNFDLSNQSFNLLWCTFIFGNQLFNLLWLILNLTLSGLMAAKGQVQVFFNLCLPVSFGVRSWELCERREMRHKVTRTTVITTHVINGNPELYGELA